MQNYKIFFLMTNFDKELFIECGKSLASCIVALLMLFFACVMCGCTKTQHMPIKEYHTETIRTDSTTFLSLLQTLRDIGRSRQSSSDTTIIIHNERAKVNENGDTIGYESNTDTYKSTSKEREYLHIIEILRDSVRQLKAEKNVVKVDSVPVPYPVEKNLSKWEQTKMSIGGLAVCAVIIVVVVALVRWLMRKYRK